MIRRFETLGPGTRLLIGPWDHHQINNSPISGGAERAADEWPPPAERQRWYLSRNQTLSLHAPQVQAAADAYQVNTLSGTGKYTRWDTVNGRGLRKPYPDRAALGQQQLTYSTEPLAEDTEITGHPLIELHIASSATDGAVFAYLEDVAPDGQVVHVSEGQLRALHRKVQPGPAPYWTPGPYHSFRKQDAQPLVPGQIATLSFDLLPTSYQFKAGHRIRLALSGADPDHFANIPSDGPLPNLLFHRSKSAASWLELPVVR